MRVAVVNQQGRARVGAHQQESDDANRMALALLQRLKTATGFSTWQIIMLGLIIIVAVNYLTVIYFDKINQPMPIKTEVASTGSKEGFEDQKNVVSPTDAEAARYEWLNNEQLYDHFFASIYDLLVQPSTRAQAEVSFLLNKWKNPREPLFDKKYLVGGCGTGVDVLAFANAGVGRVVGIDKSQAMLDQARTVNLPASVLKPERRNAIEWRKRDLIDPAAAQPAEFDAAALFYFTIYYIKDLDGLFRNLALWVKPGGHLAVHCVNKYKFDPLLESANPFVFTPQKYSKHRITKSKVTFDKFDYEAVFDLDEETPTYAEFRETFRYKDGSVRRQRHTFTMNNLPIIVQKAKAAGWNYEGYIDQVKQGYEYHYLLLFTH
jgi:SAM-dependent methyltransferase